MKHGSGWACPRNSPRTLSVDISFSFPFLSHGNDLDKTSYIKEMTDDADSQESLFNQIEIDGDVNTAVPGDYTLTYHVTDSDGNRSNAAVLTVHVQ